MTNQVIRNKSKRKQRSQRRQKRQSAGSWNPFSSKNRKKAKKSVSRTGKKLSRSAKKKAKSVNRSYRKYKINRDRKSKSRKKSKKLSKLDKKKESLFNISQDEFESMNDDDLRDREHRIDSLLDDYDKEIKSAQDRDEKQRKEERMEARIARSIRSSSGLTRINSELHGMGDKVKSNTEKLEDISSTVKNIEKVLEGMQSFTSIRDRMTTQEQEQAKEKADSALDERLRQFDILEDRDNAPDSAAVAGSDLEEEIKRIERSDAAAAAAESTIEGPGNVFDEPRSLGEKITDAMPSMPSLGSSEPSTANAYAQDINQEVPTTGIKYEGLPSTPSPPGSELERAEPPLPQGIALAGADEGELDSLAPMRAKMGGGGRYYYY